PRHRPSPAEAGRSSTGTGRAGTGGAGRRHEHPRRSAARARPRALQRSGAVPVRPLPSAAAPADPVLADLSLSARSGVPGRRLRSADAPIAGFRRPDEVRAADLDPVDHIAHHHRRHTPAAHRPPRRKCHARTLPHRSGAEHPGRDDRRRRPGRAAVGPAGLLPIVTLVLLISGGIAGHVFNDWRLSQAIKSHEARVLAEFPTVAELLALSITAGEGSVEALGRVCRTCSGDLVDELRAARSATRTGTPLVEALVGMAKRIAIPEIVQFVDGLAVSMTRGTPLAEVLRSQAADVREQSRRRLLELSGRKEIGMLIPVVVFVLPVTVIFAVFPSLTLLDLRPW